MPCIDCNKALSRSAEYKKCLRCRGCYKKFNIGENHHSWKGGKSNCDICGEKTKCFPSQATRCISCSIKEKSGEKHHSWKGEEAKYAAIHHWVRKHFNKNNCCDICNKKQLDKRFDWANISGEYKRVRTDWLFLCRPCHYKFDSKVCPPRSKETGRFLPQEV